MDSTYQNEERERERVVLHHCWGHRERSSRCHRRDVLVSATNEMNAHQVPERGGDDAWQRRTGANATPLREREAEGEEYRYSWTAVLAWQITGAGEREEERGRGRLGKNGCNEGEGESAIPQKYKQ